MQQGHIRLDRLLEEAVRALSVLDAAALEGLVALIKAGGKIDPPQSPDERARTMEQHWVFRHLHGSTARHLGLLQRVSEGEFRRYGKTRVSAFGDGLGSAFRLPE